MKKNAIVLILSLMGNISYAQTLQSVTEVPNGNYTTKNIWIGMLPTTDAVEQALNLSGKIKLLGTNTSFSLGTDGIQSTIYRSGSNSGSYPFNVYDNLILQAGNGNKDILFVTGITPTPRMVITGSGNIGIGTAAPAYRIDMNSGIMRINNGANNGFRIGYATLGNTNYNNFPYLSFNAMLVNSDPNTLKNEYQPMYSQGGGLVILGDAGNSGLHFYQKQYNGSNGPFDLTSFTEAMTLTPGGNLGIGTNVPGTNKLAVEGTIAARRVKVLASGWADFVLASDYQLPDLQEVARYIKLNGHLKDIPTEKEVAKDGVDLGEMNKLLLQKVEELTLYLIDLKKDNETLREENRQILERVSQLEIPKSL